MSLVKTRVHNTKSGAVGWSIILNSVNAAMLLVSYLDPPIRPSKLNYLFLMILRLKNCLFFFYVEVLLLYPPIQSVI